MYIYIVVYLSKYNLYLFCLFMSGPVVRMAFIFNIFPGHLKLKNQKTRTVSKERKINHGPPRYKLCAWPMDFYPCT